MNRNSEKVILFPWLDVLNGICVPFTCFVFRAFGSLSRASQVLWVNLEILD